MKKQILILIVLALVVFIVATVLFSFYQVKQLAEPTGKVALPASLGEKKAEKQARAQRKLVPSRPQDYGMVVFEPGQGPKTQAEWDNLIRKQMQELKTKTASIVWAKVQQKIKEDPQKTQDKIKQIDDTMQELQDNLAKDPENQEIKQRLNHLMILRSLTQEFPESSLK